MNELTQQAQDVQIIGLNESEAIAIVNNNMPLLRDEYLEVSAIQSLGKHHKHMETTDTSQSFYIVHPTIISDDGIRKLVTSTPNGGAIYINRLERGSPLLWSLSILDYNIVKSDNGEIAFDTITMKKLTVNFIEDPQSKTISLVHFNKTKETLSNDFSKNESMLIRNIGMMELTDLCSVARNKFINIVSNGGELGTFKSVVRRESNVIVNDYHAK